MANEYLKFLGKPQMPPDTDDGGDDDVPLRTFEKRNLDAPYKYNDAPDVWHYGELERLLRTARGDDDDGEFSPSWEPSRKDPMWEFFSTMFSPWELERQFLGLKLEDKPSFLH